MIRLPVVGVDPGHSETGIVLRLGDELLEHSTVIRDDEPDGRYVDRVNAVVNTRSELHKNCLVAVEGVRAPNPHVGRVTNVTGLLGTAIVLGGVLAWWPDALVIPPGGNGSGPLAAYPEALRPTRGRGAGKDNLRHERSAWDVAGAALTLATQTARSA